MNPCEALPSLYLLEGEAGELWARKLILYDTILSEIWQGKIREFSTLISSFFRNHKVRLLIGLGAVFYSFFEDGVKYDPVLNEVIIFSISKGSNLTNLIPTI